MAMTNQEALEIIDNMTERDMRNVLSYLSGRDRELFYEAVSSTLR